MGRKSKCEKRGRPTRALDISNLKKRKGKELSRVRLTVRTAPFPSGSDLLLGSYIKTVSGLILRGKIQGKLSNFFLLAGKKLPTLRRVVNAKAKIDSAMVSRKVEGFNFSFQRRTSSHEILQYERVT